MMKLYYAGGYVVVGDELSGALMHYARVLANADAADVVSFRAVLDDGEVGESWMLIGPSSQLFAVPDGRDQADLDDAVNVQSIEQRTRSFQPHRATVSVQQGDFSSTNGYDFM
jgi:hypothetical protein